MHSRMHVNQNNNYKIYTIFSLLMLMLMLHDCQ